MVISFWYGYGVIFLGQPVYGRIYINMVQHPVQGSNCSWFEEWDIFVACSGETGNKLPALHSDIRLISDSIHTNSAGYYDQ